MWFDVIETNGEEVHIRKSIANDSISLYERYSYNSKYISFTNLQYHYWTNQFSYYIQVTIEDVSSTGYNRVLNTSDSYMISTNQSII